MSQFIPLSDSQQGGDGAVQTQSTGSQTNTVTQTAPGGGSKNSPGSSIVNNKHVIAGGDALVSRSIAKVTSKSVQKARQGISNRQSQKAGDNSDQDQTAGSFRNRTTQTANGGGMATSGESSIVNNKGVVAGGDALVSRSIATVTSKSNQTAKQSITNEQKQRAGDNSDQEQTTRLFENRATQTANGGGMATSGESSIVNNDKVVAGGDALVSRSIAKVASKSGQTAEQNITSTLKQKAGDGGTGQAQFEEGFSNGVSPQTANGGGLAISGESSIENNDKVVAGRNALVSQSIATVTSKSGQTANQRLSYAQTQRAGDNSDQEQRGSDFIGSGATQPANGGGSASAEGSLIVNKDEVAAGGDALISQSIATVTSESAQTAKQALSYAQTQRAGDNSDQDQLPSAFNSLEQQIANSAGSASAGRSSIENNDKVIAGGDALVSESIAAVTAMSGQTAEQRFSLVQKQRASDNNGTDGQNQNDFGLGYDVRQTANGGGSASAEGSSIENKAEVNAGGDALMSQSIATITSKSGQTAKQRLSYAQTQRAGDNRTQGQGVNFHFNRAQQIVNAGGTATSGESSIENKDEVDAGSDALMSQSIAAVTSKSGQTAQQSNESAQRQRAGNDSSQNQSTSTFENAGPTPTQAVNAGGTATSGESSIKNRGEVDAGGDALMSQSIATVISESGQRAQQSNSNVQKQTAGDGSSQEQSASSFDHRAAQTATAGGTATSGGSSIVNTKGVVAGGDALVSKSIAKVTSKSGQMAKQSNESAQRQKIGEGNNGQIQSTSSLSNMAEQEANGGGTAISAGSSIENNAKVEAGGDALVSRSIAIVTSESGQTAEQSNRNAQRQKAGDFNDNGQMQDAAIVDNIATQTANDDPAMASAGESSIVNKDQVEAGGDALMSQSIANVTSKSGQTAEQSNENAQRQKAAAESGGGQLQDAAIFGNTATQTATGGGTASSEGSSIFNKDEVEAGGDALVSRSIANVTSTSGQTAQQSNENDQKQRAGDLSGGQTQGAGSFENSATQTATAGGAATSGESSIVNKDEVEAGGDALVSRSIANVTSKSGQTAQQSNESAQRQKAGNEGSDQTQGISSVDNMAEQEANGGGTASSGRSSVVNRDEVDAGGDALVSRSIAAVTSNNGQTAQQSNGSAQRQIAGDDGTQDQGPNSLTNTVTQAVSGDGSAISGESSIENNAKVEAGGNALASQSIAAVTSKSGQTAAQSNESAQTQRTGDRTIQDQFSNALTNTVTQTASGGGSAVSKASSIENNANVAAGGDALASRSIATVTSKSGQTAEQSNGNPQSQEDGNGPVSQEQIGGDQTNTSTQSADGITASAESGPVVITSNGQVEAGGGGMAGQSMAIAGLSIDQGAEQSNSNAQDQKAGNGTINQFQEGANQTNTSTQSADGNTASAESGSVVITSNDRVEAGGDGMVGQSIAIAGLSINQHARQSNSNEQDQKAGDGTVNQTQTGGNQSNTAMQSADGNAASAESGNVVVTSKDDVKAGGDGMVGQSIAKAVVKIDQNLYEVNTSNQSQKAVDPGATQIQTPSGQSNAPTQSASGKASALSGTVTVTSGGNVNAGGSGLVGQSIAISEVDIDQHVEQNNGGTPVQSVGVVDPAFSGAVTVNSHGKVHAGKYGVLAQSLASASEGGNATSGAVRVHIYDDVTAGKTGILAASLADAPGGTTAQGDVTVVVKKGTVTGGNGYYGIAVLGGDQNLIKIGKRATVTSLSGDAIFGGDEDETVKNNGTVIGNVDLGGGSNAFFNYGNFYMGSIVNLNGGPLINWGLVSPGVPGVIQIVSIDTYEQMGSGTYFVDIDMGNTKSDRLNATGKVILDGKVVGNIIANPQTGEQTVTIVSAAGGTTDNGVEAADTALVDYTIGWTGTTDVTLHMDVNFAPMALAKEPWGLGEHLNAVFTGGGPAEMEDLAVALLKLENLSDVDNAYWQLLGENYRALPESTLYSAQQFFQDMNSCQVRDGSVYSIIDEDQCLWARVRWRELDVSSNASTTGYDDEAVSILGGAQWTLNGPWRVGVAGGYENSDVSTNGPRVSSDGDRGHLGATVKYINGPWLASGTIAGGWTSYDSKRWVSFPGFAATAKSDQDISNIGGQLRGAYLMNAGGTWYAKPQVDLNVIHVDMDGFTETGGGGAALKVSGTDETVFIATPALEVGTQIGLKGGTLVRPFVRGGVSFYSDADFPLVAGFAAAPGVVPFKTTGELDDILGNISAGVTVLGTGRGVVTLSYDGSFGDDVESHSASAKASWRY